ncbi:MAG: hypothetical protein IJS81_03125, partial [Selenomonadaceae bacterium]|nr:hypothetical protein [Selenomonadaceae bacterium]
MRKIILTFMLMIIFSAVAIAKDTQPETDFETREIQLICAFSLLAAYSDDESFLVRNSLDSRGWKIDALKSEKNGVKTKAYTISKTFHDG